MTATTVDLPVASPVGELRYRPQPPWADEGPYGMCLQWQPDHFGCFEAALSTLLGVGFADVPRGPIGDHTKTQELGYLERLDAWLADRGYRMRRGPITRAVLNRAWIGVGVDPRPGWSHTVVCFCRSVVHDVALRFGLSFVDAGLEVAPITQLDEAIVFDRLENDEHRAT